jgi:type IX secretion system PorP/SprF family membrane protein
MRLTWLLPFILLAFFQSGVRSQDIHWSQIDQVQSYQNPSYIGQFDDDIKFLFAAKDQWRSVTKPYQTYFIATDTKFRKYEWFSLGFNLFTDVVGDGSFRTNQIDLISKFEKKINSKIIFSLGFDFGLTNKNIDFTKFKFDNQYNGFKYDELLSINETFNNSSFLHSTLGTGTSIKLLLHKNNELLIGYSIFNINQPSESFYSKQIIRPIRTNYNVVYKYYGERHNLSGSINYDSQKTYKKTLIGFFDDIKTNNFKIHHFHLGMAYRNLDAFILHIGLSHLKSKMILSYDINISKLNIASQGRGSFEVNIQYLLQKKTVYFPIKPICTDYF